MVNTGCDLNLVEELIQTAELRSFTVEMVIRTALNNVVMRFT